MGTKNILNYRFSNNLFVQFSNFLSQSILMDNLGKKLESGNGKKKKLPIYEKGTWYAITMSPDDDHQYYDKRDRLKLVKDKFYIELLQLGASRIHYRYSLDISQPDHINYKSIGPRIHLHGRVMFGCTGAILDWQLIHLFRLSRWNDIQITTIDDTDEWDKYCDKYNHITKLTPFTSFDTHTNGGKNKKNIDFPKDKISSIGIDNASRKTSENKAQKKVKPYTGKTSTKDSE